jgi:release factor glutamine methyltransferase
MTIREIQVRLQSQLQTIYAEREASNIVHLVMEFITGQKRIDRLMNSDKEIDADEAAAFKNITPRLLNHEPVQYVLGEAWFYGMPLKVDANVLIPRPETEELVQWIIETVKDWPQPANRNYKIMDVGTGSGCIAIALKKNLPEYFESWACDKSDGALTLARQNADEQKALVDFVGMDFLDAPQRMQLPHIDIIVSNPPYIPMKGQKEMDANVLNFEPAMALFVPDEDPLLFYKALADFGKQKLQSNGYLFVEIHESLGKAVTDLFKAEGYKEVVLKKDMQGKDRMVRSRC